MSSPGPSKKASKRCVSCQSNLIILMASSASRTLELDELPASSLEGLSRLAFNMCAAEQALNTPPRSAGCHKTQHCFECQGRLSKQADVTPLISS
jgi:hypothetical protein